jgi:integrase
MKVLNPVLRMYYARADGTYPVHFRIQIQGRKKWISTGIKIPAGNWSKIKHRVIGVKNADDLNLVIEKIRNKIDDIFIRYKLMNRKITLELFTKEFENPGVYSDFNSYALKYIKDKKNIVKENTILSMSAAVNKLMEYRPVILFADLNADLVNDYRKYMKKKFRNNANTIAKNFTTLRAIARKAVNDKIIEINPFTGIRLSRSQPDRVHLSREELIKIWKNRKNLPENQYKVLRFFLFSCFTGLRLSDMRRILPEDIREDCIYLRPLKTQNTTNEIVTIPLTSYTKELLQEVDLKPGREIFRDMYTDQVINRYLKTIMGVLEVKKEITFHSGRHTFATLFLELNPGDVATLQNLLGHSSIQHTMVYVHIDERVKRERMGRLEKVISDR